MRQDGLEGSSAPRSGRNTSPRGPEMAGKSDSRSVVLAETIRGMREPEDRGQREHRKHPGFLGGPT